MANYNTFVVVDCKSRKSILTTSSARKAKKLLSVGFRIDIWNNNEKIDTVHYNEPIKMKPFVMAEKEYIRKKQQDAERRNKYGKK